MPGMWTLGLNNTLARGFTVGASALHAGAGVLWDAWTGVMGKEAVWGRSGCAGAQVRAYFVMGRSGGFGIIQ